MAASVNKRLAAWAALIGIAMGGTIVGTGWAAFRTQTGAELMTNLAVDLLSDVVSGTANVESITGNILTGLTITNLEIRDDSGELFVRLPVVVVRYRLIDLLSRRIVLGRVHLEDPYIHLYQMPNGRFNHEEVLGLGGDDSDSTVGGPSPLIAFRDAHIRNGTIVVRTPVDSIPADADWEITGRNTSNPLRLYRFYDIDADVQYVRIASPFEGENGLEFDVRHLSAVMNDPFLDIQDLRGRINIDGTTMALDLERLRLPGTFGQMQGEIRWPGGDFLVDLDVDASSWAVNDVRAFAPRLPWDMEGEGRVRLVSLSPDSMSIRADPIRLEGPGGGGNLRGRIGLVVGSRGLSAVRDASLEFDNLDLDYIRPLVDTLPFDGRLDGRMDADGMIDSMSVALDWWFRDTLVAGTPQTEIFGRGGIAMDDSGLGFKGFRIDSATIDLRTINNMFPGIALRGTMGGVGSLTGILNDATYQGAMWHRDGTLPTSSARGTVRLNTQRDTLGLWTDLVFDSLHLAGIAPSYPTLPTNGSFAGEVHIRGYADSMALTSTLSGPPGLIDAEGAVVMLPSVLGLEGLRADIADVDVSQFDDTLLPTELYGTLFVDVLRDSLLPFAASVRFALDTSFVAESEVDSVRGTARVADSLFSAEELAVWSRALSATTNGAFGLGPNRAGELLVDISVDSLGWFGPIIRQSYPFLASGDLLDNLDGEASGQVTLSGAVGDYETNVVGSIDEARSDSLYAAGMRLDASWHTDFSRDMGIRFALDTVAYRQTSYSDVSLRLAGPKGVAGWDARARIGLDGSLAAWGQSFTDEQNVILPMDSMRLLLPTLDSARFTGSHTWDLRRGAIIAASDSGFVFANFIMESVDTGSRFQLGGLFPTNGSASLRGEFVALPIADLWALMQRDPTTASGNMSGDFQLAGTAALPQLTSSLAISRGRIGAVRIPQLQGTLAYDARRLTGDYEVRSSGEVVLEVDFSLPLDLALRTVPRRQVDGPLRVDARADGVELAFVELFTTNVRNSSGSLSADVGIAGSWDSPLLRGQLEIRDGSTDVIPIGVTHRNMQGRVSLSGDSIIVDQLSLAAGQGTLRVGGIVRLENLTDPILNLTLEGNNFRTVAVPDFMTLTTSGRIGLTGPLFGSTLTGNATVTEGQVYFADLVEKRVVDLDDELVSTLVDDEFFRRAGLRLDEGRRLVRGRFENRFLNELRIQNLSFTMGSNVDLRSSEANIQLSGQVNVNKTLDIYRLDGTLNTPRGIYLMPLGGEVIGGLTREFTVTGGEVRYFGTTDWNAELSINAQHVVRSLRREDLNVFVNIGGTLFDPVLTLSSDRQPPIPQTEVISYLLFGAPSVEAFGESSGNSQAGYVFGEVTGAFTGPLEQLLIGDIGIPLDYLRFQPQITQGFLGVTLGKQLGPRWFVNLNPRVCPNQADFNLSADVEFRLTRTWLFSFNTEPVRPCSLLASRFTSGSSRQQFGADLFWERRYR